jgi:DNA-binding NtrC family response regulator
MNRRSFFQRFGALAGAGFVGDRVAAQHLCDRVAVRKPPSIDESLIDKILYERLVIGNYVWDLIPIFVRSHTTLLVSGEPGSGRTVAARLIHEQSPWADAPLKTIDCSLPGASWGAWWVTRGTLVLENVSALNKSEQKLLLQRMQEDSLPDRVICTTAPMLRRLVDRRIFSEELYHRINVISLELQPLRERPDVILPLAEYAAIRAAAAQNKLVPQITPDAGDALLRYRWPGNVRELERVITLAVSRSRHNAITASDVIVESRSS